MLQAGLKGWGHRFVVRKDSEKWLLEAGGGTAHVLWANRFMEAPLTVTWEVGGASEFTNWPRTLSGSIRTLLPGVHDEIQEDKHEAKKELSFFFFFFFLSSM